MNKKIKIIADENIPKLDELLGDVAEIKCIPGRQINADCLLTLTSDDYEEVHLIEPSGIYLLPRIDRPNLEDGKEVSIQFSCAFPWDIESDSTDNQIIIILTGGEDDDDGIQDLETGLLSASLIIGLAITMAWLVKNHRERKEMMRKILATQQRVKSGKLTVKGFALCLFAFASLC